MANPAFNDKTYDRFGQGTPEESGYGYGSPTTPYGGYAQAQAVPQAQSEVMTVEGTINKTLILFALLLASGAFSWSLLMAGNALVLPLMIGGALGAFIVGIVTSFRPQNAAITAPIYAVLEGLALGAISALFQSVQHGIVAQAVGLTLAVFATMLTLYRTGLIKVTEKLKMGIIAATAGLCVVYMMNWVLVMFGVMAIHNTLWSNGPVGIGISVLIAGVAAFNLLLDFDLIDRGVARRVPKFMEWYAGYGLMVTIVWLYLELLRLLLKLRQR